MAGTGVHTELAKRRRAVLPDWVATYYDEPIEIERGEGRHVWDAEGNRIDPIKQNGELTGSRVRVKVVKNKVAPPFKTAEFDIMYGSGISKEGSILDLGVEYGIVNKSGSWFTYEDERLGQGREAAKEFLRTNPDLRLEIEQRVRIAAGLDSPTSDDLDGAEQGEF